MEQNKSLKRFKFAVTKTNWLVIQKRRITFWIGGILLGVLAAYLSSYTKSILDPIVAPGDQGSALACLATAKTFVKDESKFQILISPIDGDENKFHTRRLLTPFLGGTFNARMSCEHLVFDMTKGTDEAFDEVRKKGKSMLDKYHADLLLFGQVTKKNETVELWAVNATGGCEAKPKKIELGLGFALSKDDIGLALGAKILATTMEELSSACREDASTNWDVVEQRTKKVQAFLANVPSQFTFDQVEDISQSFADAMQLLYSSGKSEWFEHASLFNLDRANRVYASNPQRRSYWLVEQGLLLKRRWLKSKSSTDWSAALAQYQEAINADVSNWLAYAMRANIHALDNQPEKGMADMNTAITLRPEFRFSVESEEEFQSLRPLLKKLLIPKK
jgi:hypothetical protein